MKQNTIALGLWIVFLCGAILLSGCTNLNSMISLSDQSTGHGTTNDNVDNVTVSQNTSTQQNVTDDTCKQNAVYFVYADWCPHCQKMKPIVAELESQGYVFEKVNSQDSVAVGKANACLKEVTEIRLIPTFACLSNKQSHVGEFANADEMKAFAEACGAKVS